MTDPSQLLCTRCGLCCDGSLFADVELRDEGESVAVEAMGLEVEEEEGRELLVQPCGALNGTACGVYPHRPECCRTFECRLLRDYQAGGVSQREALEVIASLRGLIACGDRNAAQSVIEERFLKSPA